MKTVQEDLALRLRRTELLLLRAVRRQRERPEMREKGGFWGSNVTDDEVDALLMEHGEYEAPRGVDGMAPAIAATTQLRDAKGGRFGHLREVFRLSGDDADLLLLAIAPEISAGYAKIFSYLHDNLAQGYLTVDAASRILRDGRTERIALTARLMRSAPLVKNRLVLLTPEEGVEAFSSRRVAIAPRLLRWLIEEEELPQSAGFRPLDTAGDLLIPQSTHQRLDALGEGLKESNSLVIVGATEGAREAVAIRIAQLCKRPIVRIDMERCAEYLNQPWDLIRELYLSQAIPYLVNVLEAQDDPSQRIQLSQLGNVLSSIRGPVLIGAADRRTVKGLLGNDRPSITIVTGKTHLEERHAAWSKAISARGWDSDKAMHVAERFYSISGTTIARVLDRASAEAGANEPTVEQLWAAAREGARPEFRGLAQHIVPRFSWDDLILSEKIQGELNHLVSYLEHQETIFHRWGARDIRPRGYGMKALFSGPPGTGKTMAAEVISGELGLDMFRVDLSQVISRWVGETEKNLKQIFDAAEGGVALILFDEADALFGSRGEVKQAQDRFANQEVSFLLQRLETFEGCAILTTNLQENIDEAFLRRFGAVVEFQMPSPKQRELLWHKAIPKMAPKDPNLDLERLAKQFVLAGGSIVNAAINACVLAAKEDSPVAMKHAVRAVGKELIKMGKQVNRVHFGEFYDEVADL